jgi:hypothetical protein
MTNTILTFPIISRSPLSCTWVQTGNPESAAGVVSGSIVRYANGIEARERPGASANLGEKESA